MQEDNSNFSAFRPLSAVSEAASTWLPFALLSEDQQSCLSEDKPDLNHAAGWYAHMPSDAQEGLPGGQHVAAVSPHVIYLQCCR